MLLSQSDLYREEVVLKIQGNALVAKNKQSLNRKFVSTSKIKPSTSSELDKTFAKIPDSHHNFYFANHYLGNISFGANNLESSNSQKLISNLQNYASGKNVKADNSYSELLPLIKKYNNKVIIIKYGGSVFKHEDVQKNIIKDITLLKKIGAKPIIVHGGGPEINKELEKMSIKPEFIEGQRVTRKEVIDVVEKVLGGKINKGIASLIEKQDLKPFRISGKEGNTLLCEKKLINNKDCGFIGKIKEVNHELIQSLLDGDYIPVISPIGFDNKGNAYNVNADYAALEIAKSLHSEKLVFLSNVEGVLKDRNDPKSLIPRIPIEEVQGYIDEGIISDGMLPKILSCKDAVVNGVKKVHIIDGRMKHSLLIEMFTKQGIGTTIESTN